MHDNGKPEPTHGAAPRPRLFESLKAAVETRHYSRRTQEAYLHWIKRFIVFTGKRHPRELGAPEITAFLSHLAVEGRVAAATQNQALAALLFLYKVVLGEPLPWLVVETTMIYTHVMNKGGRGVKSPLDCMEQHVAEYCSR